MANAEVLLHGGAGGDVFTFDASLSGQTITLQAGLTLLGAGTIDGDINNDHVPDITISGNDVVSILTATKDLTVQGLVLTHGSAEFGGAIAGGLYVAGGPSNIVRYDVTIEDSILTHNAATTSGGAVLGYGTVTITNSTISDNTADISGGGVVGSSVILNHSTVSGNVAGLLGGGLSATTIVSTDSTISGNSTLISAVLGSGSPTVGGGIMSHNGTVTLINTTVEGNSSEQGGGVVASTVNLTNSIILGNTSAVGEGDLVDLFDSPVLNLTGNNIVSGTVYHGVTSVGTTTAADVFAGGLADHGGFVQTIALKGNISNPAIDAAVGGTTQDARGEAGFDFAGVDNNGADTGVRDLGAYEAGQETPSLVVTTADDVVDGLDGMTSLREAVAYANLHAGADTIRFDASLDGATITLDAVQGVLNVTEALTIDGDRGNDHRADITVSGNDAVQILHATAALTVEGMVLTHGSATTGGAIYAEAALTVTDSVLSHNAASGDGGAIRSLATTTITGSTISDNQAGNANAGGGVRGNTVNISDSTISGNGASDGGGLYANSLHLTNSTVAGNTAGGVGGGLISANLTLENVTVTGNSASTDGGFVSAVSTTISNSIVLGNSSGFGSEYLATSQTLHGGNILGTNLFSGSTDVGDTTAADVFNGGLADHGGLVQTVALKANALNPAIDAAVAGTTTDARGEAAHDFAGVDNNGVDTGFRDLGAFEVQPEAGSLVVTTADDVVDAYDGQTSLREAVAYANAHAGADAVSFDSSLDGTTITLDAAQGALNVSEALTIDGDRDNDHRADITVSGNDAVQILHATAALTVEGMVLTHGSATDGGAIGSTAALTITDSVLSHNAASHDGGAVHSSVSVTIAGTTISDNQAGGLSGAGGGVFGNTVTVSDSTISGNSASLGGGISGSTLHLTNSTVAANSATGDGGFSASSVTLENVTVSGNSATGVGGFSATGIANITNSIILGNSGSAEADFSGATTTLTGGNIIGTNVFSGSTDVGDTTAADVFDGGLADHGGLVQTIALKSNLLNPALDAAVGGTVTDARDVAAVDVPGLDNNGGASGFRDLGAYEAETEAGSLVVTTDLDVVDPLDGLTSLREAVAYANAHAGADTISFDASVDGATITLNVAKGALSVTEALTIDGDIDDDHVADITVSGNDAVQIITTSAALTVQGMVLTHGRGVQGGAIASNLGANLTISESTLSHNLGLGDGGAVYANGTVTITGSTISGNSSATGNGGGILGGTITVTDSTIDGNSGRIGGGISGGTISLTNTTLANNSASVWNGGFSSVGAVSLTNSTITGNAAAGLGGAGGAVTTVLTNSVVTGNTALSSPDLQGATALVGNNILGGTVYHGITSVGTTTAADVFDGGLADHGGLVQTIALKGNILNPALDAADDTGTSTDARGEVATDIVGLDNNGAATGVRDLGAFELTTSEASSLVVTTADDVVDAFDGETSLREAVAYANAHAGADTVSFDASLDGATITLDAALGVLNVNQALTIDGDSVDDHDADITVSGNDAVQILHTSAALTVDGMVLTHGSATTGGAIGSTAALTITDSVLSQNAASANGGAVYSLDSVTITGSTISDNQAGSSDAGGGVAGNTVTVSDSTISGNTAYTGGGIDAVTLQVTNSTIAGNTGHTGGGMVASSVTLENVTVTGNTATIGGGVYSVLSATVTNSIILGNSAGTGADYTGAAATLHGGNIVGTNVYNGSTDVGDTTASNVFAGSLANNGGLVQTVALTGSILNPALDAADDTATSTDARGVAAADMLGLDNNGGATGVRDLGAFELVTAEASSLVVTTADDVVDAFDGETSLREAVAYANAHAGADTISFDASLDGATITLGAGLSLTGETTIDGDRNDDHAANVTVSGGGSLRPFFSISALTIQGLNITQGHTARGLLGADGGAINGDSDVTVIDSTISGSDGDQGGAIYAQGTVTVINSTLTGNSAISGGAVWGRNVELVNATIADNQAQNGGGVYTTGTITLTHSTITGNYASSSGGGTYSANLDATDSIILGNAANADQFNEVLHFGTPSLSHTTGGNIIGENVYSGSTITGTTDADAVFASTYDNHGRSAGAVQDNGGSVWTAALNLMLDNPALDRASTGNPLTDARGEDRVDQGGVANVNGTGADLGAFEAADIPPQVLITAYASELRAGQTATVSFVFNQIVTDFGLDDVTVENGTLGSLTTTDGGKTWTATYTPHAGVTDDFNVITVDLFDIDDQNGVSGAGTSTSNVFAIDTRRPTAGVVVADTSLKAGESTGVTITFSERVTGLTAADLTVPRGALTGLASTDGGKTWTATLTRNSAVLDATNVITLDMTGVRDLAGNTGLGTVQSNNYAFVNTAPTAVVLSRLHDPIAENADTSHRILFARISVQDSDGGDNRLSLAGADKALFEIDGNKLYLKAGVHLDYETNPALDVTVRVNDPGVGGAIDASASAHFRVLDRSEVITGTPLADTLQGGAVSEIIRGLAGDDIIRGGRGDDRIVGGGGADTLTGEAGTDVFVFNRINDSGGGQNGLINNGTIGWQAGLGQRDVITDFTHGVDRIDLSAIDANTLRDGDQAFRIRSDGTFNDRPGGLIVKHYNLAGTALDRTVIYGDVNGDHLADFQIELAGLVTVSRGDLIL